MYTRLWKQDKFDNPEVKLLQKSWLKWGVYPVSPMAYGYGRQWGVYPVSPMVYGYGGQYAHIFFCIYAIHEFWTSQCGST